MFCKNAANVFILMCSGISTICNIPTETSDTYNLITKEKLELIFDYCLKNDILHVSYILGSISDISFFKEVTLKNKSYIPIVSANCYFDSKDEVSLNANLSEIREFLDVDIFNIFVPPELMLERNIISLFKEAHYYEKKGCRFNIYTNITTDNYRSIKESVSAVFNAIPSWRGIRLFVLNSHNILKHNKYLLLEDIVNNTKNITLQLLPIMDDCVSAFFPNGDYVYPSVGVCPIFRTSLIINSDGFIETCDKTKIIGIDNSFEFSDLKKYHDPKCHFYRIK